MPAPRERHIEPPPTPAEFERAVEQLRAARFRPEILTEEMPAPQRIAPYASALSADVNSEGMDIGTGRLVVLHARAGNVSWEGTYRCVAYAGTDIAPEPASDPLLAEVG